MGEGLRDSLPKTRGHFVNCPLNEYDKRAGVGGSIMANLKAIRRRISSVKSTQKITRAMKMVAAARLRRAQIAALKARPFAGSCLAMSREIAPHLDEQNPHPLTVRPQVGATAGAAGADAAHSGTGHAETPSHSEAQRFLYLAISSDRGLAGGFNQAIIKACATALRTHRVAGEEVAFITLGKRVDSALNRLGVPVLAHRSIADFQNDFKGNTKQLARELSAHFLEGRAHTVRIISTHFISAMTQEVRATALLPLKVGDDAATKAQQADGASTEAADVTVLNPPIFEPSAEALFAELAPLTLNALIYSAVRESVASEHSARMAAMDSATKNASDMIGRLTLQYNRARQAAITTELVEIISGAQAISG